MEMLCEDLKAQNKRLNQRNKELVEAYWPLMSKIQRRGAKDNHEKVASNKPNISKNVMT